MLDKNDDTFFDEKKGKDEASEQLMQMVDNHIKKISTEFQTGSQIQGTVTNIGREYIFVDIGAKNEAIIKKDEFINDNSLSSISIGDTLSAYITSYSPSEIILSKSLIKHNASRNDLIEAYNNKIPVKGKVTGVSKDGITAKIMGHRAFCPISQIDIKFTENVNLFLGQTLDFVITRFSGKGNNIILSRIPLLEQDIVKKFEELEKSIEEHTIIKGTITKITDFGIFIDIGTLEGLVHISEISWEHIDKPQDKFSIGQEIECIVLQVIRKQPLKKSKISLSIKQLHDNPWHTVETKLKPGQSVQGTVVRLTNFGAFVELFPGIDGLLHVSEMSWVKKIHHPSEILSIGNSIKVTILSIDSEKKSISLSLKDISEDPWNDVSERFPIGTEVVGTAVKKSRYGYFIDLAEGVTGLLVFSKISSEKKESIKEGDQISVAIDSIDKEKRRISLSYGFTPVTQNEEINEKHMSTNASKQTGSSTEFGAALMAALKKKI